MTHTKTLDDIQQPDFIHGDCENDGPWIEQEMKKMKERSPSHSFDEYISIINKLRRYRSEILCGKR